MEDTPIDTVNVETIMNHHMSGLKPTPRWGFGFRYIVKYENPWWFRSRPKAMVLERKWISANPKGF